MIRNFVPNLWSKKLNPPRIGVVLTVVSFSFSKAAIINKTLQREEQNAKKFSLFLSLFLSSSDEAFKQLRCYNFLCDGIFEKNFEFLKGRPLMSETLNPNFRDDAFQPCNFITSRWSSFKGEV